MGEVSLQILITSSKHDSCFDVKLLQAVYETHPPLFSLVLIDWWWLQLESYWCGVRDFYISTDTQRHATKYDHSAIYYRKGHVVWESLHWAPVTVNEWIKHKRTPAIERNLNRQKMPDCWAEVRLFDTWLISCISDTDHLNWWKTIGPGQVSCEGFCKRHFFHPSAFRRAFYFARKDIFLMGLRTHIRTIFL